MFGRHFYLLLAIIRLYILPMPLQVIYQCKHRMHIFKCLAKWPGSIGLQIKCPRCRQKYVIAAFTIVHFEAFARIHCPIYISLRFHLRFHSESSIPALVDAGRSN